MNKEIYRQFLYDMYSKKYFDVELQIASSSSIPMVHTLIFYKTRKKWL